METKEFSEVEVVKTRGFWLSAFLILMFIANPVTAFTYFSSSDVIIQAYPKITITMIYFLGSMTVVNVVLAIGVWNWKKWGVYGFYIVAAIALCINLYIGVGIAGSLSGLIGAVIMYFATKNRWEYFS